MRGKRIAVFAACAAMALPFVAHGQTMRVWKDGVQLYSVDVNDVDSMSFMTGEDRARAMVPDLYANIRWHFGYEWAHGITLYGTDEFTNAADLTSEPWNTYDERLSAEDCTRDRGAANANCPAVSELWNVMYYGISAANTLIVHAKYI